MTGVESGADKQINNQAQKNRHKEGLPRSASNVFNNASIHRLLNAIGLLVKGVVIPARTLAGIVRLFKRFLDLRHGLVGSWQEDDFGIGGLSHLLHSLEVPDLHGGCGGKNVGCGSHELLEG